MMWGLSGWLMGRVLARVKSRRERRRKKNCIVMFWAEVSLGIRGLERVMWLVMCYDGRD